MKERVFGIETEYAVVYYPARREPQGPTNLSLYPIFERHLRSRMASVPRAMSLLRSKPGRFLANGMSFHYEATPQAFENGLLEIASPECRDPWTLATYETAKDRLAEELRLEVNRELRAFGWRGEVRIFKNNVDSQGHTFGSHESYWIDDPLDGPRLATLAPLWLLTWLATLPVFLWLLGVSLLLALAPLLLVLAPLLAMAFAGLARGIASRLPVLADRLRAGGRFLADLPQRFAARMQADPSEWVRRLAWIEWPFRVAIPIHAALYGSFFFRPVLRGATAFLVTRTLYAGAGSVDGSAPASLRLSQRSPHMKTVSSIFTSGDRRPLIELRDPFFRPWSAFRRHRRLHLMLGDANLCEWALALRVGTTALVLEAIETDRDASWPELADPLAAFRALSLDPSVSLALQGGGNATGLEIQRQVLGAVRRTLGEPEIEWKRQMLSMWQETLDALDRDAEALVGRIDWVTKRALLRREVGEPEDWEALREQDHEWVSHPERLVAPRLRDLAFRALRTDLRYHDLGPRGDHRKFLERGRVERLSEPAAVDAAMTLAPCDTRAWGRGQAIREAGDDGGSATWHRVRVGHLLRFDWRFFLDPLAGDSES